MRGPLKESTLCFLIRLKPFGTCTYWLAFIGLKVLTFIFHRTQIPHLYHSWDSSPRNYNFKNYHNHLCHPETSKYDGTQRQIMVIHTLFVIQR